MTEQNQNTAASKVTIDDVRAVIGEGDPNQTNASKVRTLLGRGSFETIQKHLSTLRLELAAALVPTVSADQVPPVPTDAAASMWAAAYTAAQVLTLARSEKLAAERDAAVLQMEVMTVDLAGLVSAVDEQAAQLDRAAVTVAQVQAAHLSDVDQAKAGLLAAADELAAAKAAAEASEAVLRAQIVDLGHKVQVVEKDAANAALTLQVTIDRLTDQVGELKSLLHSQAQPQS